LDGKSLPALLKQVADKYPDRYNEISHSLLRLGSDAVQEQGGYSFGIRHLRKSEAAHKLHEEIRKDVRSILQNPNLTPQQKNDRIVLATGKHAEQQQKVILAEATAAGNPLAKQVLTGARGKPANLVSLLGGDLLYSDHRGNVIPIPVLRSYSQGLSPAEYWAATYGARKGIVDVKQATANAGFFSKQLVAASHRLMVAGDDAGDYDESSPRGLVVPVDDADNEGALLAKDFGPYRRNTPLTPKIQSDLKRRGFNDILIRSPIIGGSPEGGVYAFDVGVREGGKIPAKGEFVGIQSASALSEPISQGMLSSKHSGGVVGQAATTTGFAALNALVQVPQKMPGGAAHSTEDGQVEIIEAAPAGGQYVTIAGKQHYVPADRQLTVKRGDVVEAGDVISSGLPSPAIITQHKGVGEGRRYFTQVFRDTLNASGISAHRRNVEMLARGLLNHVQLTEETENHVPDDIVPYSTLEHTYRPRDGHKVTDLKHAAGKYLERPVLHYTIGTKVRPSVLQQLKKFGVKAVTVHDNPPPFEPHMVRGMYQMQHDPDFLVQMYGSGLKKSLLTSVARGGRSDLDSSSFVPSLAATIDFGADPSRLVYKPEKPRTPEEAIPELGLSAELDLPAPKTAATYGAAPARTAKPALPPAPALPTGGGAAAPAAAGAANATSRQTDLSVAPSGPLSFPESPRPYNATNLGSPQANPYAPTATRPAGSPTIDLSAGSNTPRPETPVTPGTPAPAAAAGTPAPAAAAGTPAETTAQQGAMNQQQLLTLLALGLMSGAGIGGLLGGRSGATLGGIGIPLLLYLLNQQGFFDTPAAKTQPDAAAGPQPAPQPAPQLPVDAWMREPAQTATGQTIDAVSDVAGEALQLAFLASAGVPAAYNAVKGVGVGAGNYLVGPQRMAAAGQAIRSLPGARQTAALLGFGKNLIGRSLGPAVYGLDALKNVRNLAEHGGENTTLINAKDRRDRITKILDSVPELFQAFQGQSKKYRDKSLMHPAFDVLTDSLGVGLTALEPVTNAQTIIGFTDMLSDEQGNPYIPAPWQDRNQLPERVRSRELKRQLRDALARRLEQPPLDAVSPPAAVSPDYLSLSSIVKGDSPQSAVDLDRLAIDPAFYEAVMEGKTIPPPKPLFTREAIFDATEAGRRRTRPFDYLPLRDRAAHPDPNRAAFLHYWRGGR
jgi:hypothetical protein